MYIHFNTFVCRVVLNRWAYLTTVRSRSYFIVLKHWQARLRDCIVEMSWKSCNSLLIEKKNQARVTYCIISGHGNRALNAALSWADVLSVQEIFEYLMPHWPGYFRLSYMETLSSQTSTNHSSVSSVHSLYVGYILNGRLRDYAHLVVKSSFSLYCGAERLSCCPRTDQILFIFTFDSSIADSWFLFITWQPLNNSRGIAKDKPVCWFRYTVNGKYVSTEEAPLGQQMCNKYLLDR